MMVGKSIAILSFLISSGLQAVELDRRIIGGHYGNIVNHPYLIKIARGGYNCGGAVISETSVLTAAHCVPSRNPREYSLFGKCNTPWYQASNQCIKLTATRIIPHERHYLQYNLNDIAIIKVQPGHGLPKIRLDFYGLVREGRLMNLAGWGVDNTGNPSYHLKEINLVALANQVCHRSLYNYFNADQHICTFGMQNYGNLCYGDSDSPVVMNNVLVGVVSYVTKKCDSGPGGLQKVSYYRDWIRYYMN